MRILLNPLRHVKHIAQRKYRLATNRRSLQKILRGINARILERDCIDILMNDSLSFVESLRIRELPYGRYLYKKKSRIPILYASAMAALFRSLVGDLDNITDEERASWINYLNEHQSPDGLYRDPLIANSIAETEDWWGWRHLTLLVLMALNSLGAKPRHPLSYLELIDSPKKIDNWLINLDWKERTSFTSNTIQNYCVGMQYARDFMGEPLSQNIQYMLNCVAERCDCNTGLWGSGIANRQTALSEGVQAGYHFWLLFWYEQRDIPYYKRAFSSLQELQNDFGGFDLNNNYSSACQDIDALHPLIQITEDYDDLYRYTIPLLQKSLPWIIFNFNDDGSAVFQREASFLYGHNLMSTDINEGSVFATWFRSLALSYVTNFLSVHGTLITARNFTHLQCPGLQYPIRRRREVTSDGNG